MIRERAIEIVCSRSRVHRETAEAWVDTLAELGAIKLIAPCAPPPEHAAARWHWCDVPVADGKRRQGCFEWVESHWGAMGRAVSPELAAEAGWRYVGPADEPMSKNEATVAAPSSGCVPPNLPLPNGRHLLVLPNGTKAEATWLGKSERWQFGSEPETHSPEDVARLGYGYVAALP